MSRDWRPPATLKHGVCAVLAAVSLQLLPTASAAGPSIDPATGYRIANYRAPTPAAAPGATTITLEELLALVRDRHAVLLDVMSAEVARPDPKTGEWHPSKPRRNMAGSVWMPDVGRGALTPQRSAYFSTNLKRLTGGDTARPIVVYCQADCWMSWNAVKRAAEFGYTALYWYPEGTDGMADWDVPLVDAIPLPLAAGADGANPEDAAAPPR